MALRVLSDEEFQQEIAGQEVMPTPQPMPDAPQRNFLEHTQQSGLQVIPEEDFRSTMMLPGLVAQGQAFSQLGQFATHILSDPLGTLGDRGPEPPVQEPEDTWRRRLVHRLTTPWVGDIMARHPFALESAQTMADTYSENVGMLARGIGTSIVGLLESGMGFPEFLEQHGLERRAEIFGHGFAAAARERDEEFDVESFQRDYLEDKRRSRLWENQIQYVHNWAKPWYEAFEEDPALQEILDTGTVEHLRQGNYINAAQALGRRVGEVGGTRALGMLGYAMGGGAAAAGLVALSESFSKYQSEILQGASHEEADKKFWRSAALIFPIEMLPWSGSIRDLITRLGAGPVLQGLAHMTMAGISQGAVSGAYTVADEDWAAMVEESGVPDTIAALSKIFVDNFDYDTFLAVAVAGTGSAAQMQLRDAARRNVEQQVRFAQNAEQEQRRLLQGTQAASHLNRAIDEWAEAVAREGRDSQRAQDAWNDFIGAQQQAVQEINARRQDARGVAQEWWATAPDDVATLLQREDPASRRAARGTSLDWGNRTRQQRLEIVDALTALQEVPQPEPTPEVIPTGEAIELPAPVTPTPTPEAGPAEPVVDPLARLREAEARVQEAMRDTRTGRQERLAQARQELQEAQEAATAEQPTEVLEGYPDITPPAPEVQQPVEAVPEAPPEAYENRTVAQLKDELRARNQRNVPSSGQWQHIQPKLLSSTGSKADMIRALEEDDARETMVEMNEPLYAAQERIFQQGIRVPEPGQPGYEDMGFHRRDAQRTWRRRDDKGRWVMRHNLFRKDGALSADGVLEILQEEGVPGAAEATMSDIQRFMDQDPQDVVDVAPDVDPNAYAWMPEGVRHLVERHQGDYGLALAELEHQIAQYRRGGEKLTPEIQESLELLTMLAQDQRIPDQQLELEVPPEDADLIPPEAYDEGRGIVNSIRHIFGDIISDEGGFALATLTQKDRQVAWEQFRRLYHHVAQQVEDVRQAGAAFLEYVKEHLPQGMEHAREFLAQFEIERAGHERVQNKVTQFARTEDEAVFDDLDPVDVLHYANNARTKGYDRGYQHGIKEGDREAARRTRQEAEGRISDIRDVIGQVMMSEYIDPSERRMFLAALRHAGKAVKKGRVNTVVDDVRGSIERLIERRQLKEARDGFRAAFRRARQSKMTPTMTIQAEDGTLTQIPNRAYEFIKRITDSLAVQKPMERSIQQAREALDQLAEGHILHPTVVQRAKDVLRRSELPSLQEMDLQDILDLTDAMNMAVDIWEKELRDHQENRGAEMAELVASGIEGVTQTQAAGDEGYFQRLTTGIAHHFGKANTLANRLFGRGVDATGEYVNKAYALFGDGMNMAIEKRREIEMNMLRPLQTQLRNSIMERFDVDITGASTFLLNGDYERTSKIKLPSVSVRRVGLTGQYGARQNEADFELTHSEAVSLWIMVNEPSTVDKITADEFEGLQLRAGDKWRQRVRLHFDLASLYETIDHIVTNHPEIVEHGQQLLQNTQQLGLIMDEAYQREFGLSFLDPKLQAYFPLQRVRDLDATEAYLDRLAAKQGVGAVPTTRIGEIVNDPMFIPRTGDRKSAIALREADQVMHELGEKIAHYAPLLEVANKMELMLQDTAFRNAADVNLVNGEETVRELGERVRRFVHPRAFDKAMDSGFRRILHKIYGPLYRLRHTAGIFGKPHIAAYQVVSASAYLTEPGVTADVMQRAARRMTDAKFREQAHANPYLAHRLQTGPNAFMTAVTTGMISDTVSARGMMGAPPVSRYQAAKEWSNTIGGAMVREGDAQAMTLGYAVATELAAEYGRGNDPDFINRLAMRLWMNTQPTRDLHTQSGISLTIQKIPLLNWVLMYQTVRAKYMDSSLNTVLDFQRTPNRETARHMAQTMAILQVANPAAITAIRQGYKWMLRAAVGGILGGILGLRRPPKDEEDLEQMMARNTIEFVGTMFGGIPYVGDMITPPVQTAVRAMFNLMDVPVDDRQYPLTFLPYEAMNDMHVAINRIADTVTQEDRNWSDLVSDRYLQSIAGRFLWPLEALRQPYRWGEAEDFFATPRRIGPTPRRRGRVTRSVRRTR